MKDFKIYIITIIVSVLLLIPALICENPVLNTFSSIGCSGIAAAIMAIFLEKANTKRECGMNFKIGAMETESKFCTSSPGVRLRTATSNDLTDRTEGLFLTPTFSGL